MGNKKNSHNQQPKQDQKLGNLHDEMHKRSDGMALLKPGSLITPGDDVAPRADVPIVPKVVVISILILASYEVRDLQRAQRSHRALNTKSAMSLSLYSPSAQMK